MCYNCNGDFMKDIVKNIINKYLLLFPEEKERQQQLIDFVNNHTSDEIRDWNNFEGHIVVSGFLYSKKEQKFLVLYHNDFKMYVYPGGHIDPEDNTLLDTVTREIKEETGLNNFELVKFNDNESIPIDIDIHHIEYNTRLDLPEHYHYDFRYLFTINEISDIHLDEEESSDFKWIDIDELSINPVYGNVAIKFKKLFDEKKI